MGEVRVCLLGGPFDGAHMVASLQFGAAFMDYARIATGDGHYRLTGRVGMPDGGAVAQYEWEQT